MRDKDIRRRFSRAGLKAELLPGCPNGRGVRPEPIPEVWFIRTRGKYGRDLGSWVPATKCVRAGPTWTTAESIKEVIGLFLMAKEWYEAALAVTYDRENR